MMAVLLIGGIGLILAGLLGIVFGIPVKEFSFGSTLILTGAIVACTGSIVIGLWTVLRELKNISKQLGHDLPVGSGSDDVWLAAGAASAVAGNKARNGGDFPFGRDQVTENADNADSAVTSTSPTKPPMPWHE